MNYSAVASQASIKKTMSMLKEHNVEPILVQDEKEAMEEIKKMIPQGASVMNGASVTLEKIGFVDYLKSEKHGWKNLHAAILAEKDPVKQSELRKHALTAEFYLGSVHALSETGEFLVASNTGSQLPHVVFSSKNVIFVVGAQKIVPTLDEAFRRLETYVVPLEDEHMQQKYGVHTAVSKIVVFKRENPHAGRSVRMILINKAIGF